MLSISNSELKVTVSQDGAELRSILSLKDDYEYIWQAGAQWPKSAPVLFPVVGTLKNNTADFKGRKISLPRHGFARENKFRSVESRSDSIILDIVSTEQIYKSYPFMFRFVCSYQLKGRTLIQSFSVENKGDIDLPFCLGGHPAFNIRHEKSGGKPYVEFSESETGEITLLNESGLLTQTSTPCLNGKKSLFITEDLFKNDALVFLSLKSKSIKLADVLTQRTLSMNFEGWPYFALWSKPGADFICLEPWMGHADFDNTDGDFSRKPGLKVLKPSEIFNAQWVITAG